jgi:hypothetical protein
MKQLDFIMIVFFAGIFIGFILGFLTGSNKNEK